MENIDKTQFEFVEVETKERPLSTKKPKGFYADVLVRFVRSKAAIVAMVLIGLLLIMSLILPLMYGFTPDTIEPNYRFVRPRNFIMSGNRTAVVGQHAYARLVGIGIAAEHHYERLQDSSITNDMSDEDFVSTISELVTEEQGRASRYSPVVRTIGQNDMGFGAGIGVNVRLDSYNEVGFVYREVSLDEFVDIRRFERDSGRNVIFPMVNRFGTFVNEDGRTETLPAEFSNNADYWFEIANAFRHPARDAEGRLIPRYARVTPMDIADDNHNIHIRLMGSVPNLGDIAFYNISAGGSAVSIRVLAYNDFIFRHGRAPAFWFGINDQGQDIFSRLATGIRTSLGLALLVSFISLAIGVVLGALSGFYGGTVDMILNRVKEIFMAVPTIVILTLMNIHLVQQGSVPMFLAVLIGFVLFSWVGFARLVRTQFFRFKNQEYVLASKTLGARNTRLMAKHIFPNSLGTLITALAVAIPSVILLEVILYFLGVLQAGVGSSTIGVLINEGAMSMASAPHVLIIPVVVFAIIMISFNLLGNALRDAFDPSQRGK